MSTIQSNYTGMTIIERLIVTGQFETFKRALKKNKDKARKILESLKLDQKTIDRLMKTKLY
ncbi:hypothetical protein [Ekhidna sp.]|uniref:hypothetical protein n=1 Tax=Ekhidna sp. TaxID=2608089 RepID=UPI0032EC5112